MFLYLNKEAIYLCYLHFIKNFQENFLRPSRHIQGVAKAQESKSNSPTLFWWVFVFIFRNGSSSMKGSSLPFGEDRPRFEFHSSPPPARASCSKAPSPGCLTCKAGSLRSALGAAPRIRWNHIMTQVLVHKRSTIDVDCLLPFLP